MPNDVKVLLRELLQLEPMKKHMRAMLIEDDKFFAEVVKIAASDDGEAGPPPSVDVKIIQFINAMTPEERTHYVKTGELPQATYTRVNTAIKEGIH